MAERPTSPELNPEGEQFLGTYEEYQLYDPRGMPGGKSVSDRLTDEYGPEGQGWRAEKHLDSQVAETIGREAYRLAREAGKLEWAGFGHADVDGNQVPKDIVGERPIIRYDVYVKPTNDSEED